MIPQIQKSLAADDQQNAYKYALALCFISGAIILVLSVLNLSVWLTQYIPLFIKTSTIVGMGFFLGSIGLRVCKIVVTTSGIVMF